MPRYLGCLASDPGRLHLGAQLLRQRIDQSSIPVQVCAQDHINADTRTHENEDSVGILLPAFDHLVVFLLRGVGVHGKERTRAVAEAGPVSRLLICC